MAGLRGPRMIQTEPWKLAQERFLRGLDGDQENIFLTATLENLFYTTSALQKDHEANNVLRSASNHLRPFIEAVEEYGRAIDVYAQASAVILCPIWGSVRVVLTMALEYQKYFDKIVTMIGRIGDVLPRFRIYERLFPDHGRLVLALADVYKDIIDFCFDAKELFLKAKKSRYSMSLKPLWKPFKQRFETYLEMFRKHEKAVERETRVSHMIEAKESREIQETKWAEMERRSNAERREALLNVLSSVNFRGRHQEVLQQKHPGTAEWIFTHPKYEAWSDQSTSACLCLFGIPGSGKTILAGNIVERIRETCDPSREVVLHYYCDHAEKASLVAANFLATLCRQLLERIEPLKIRNETEKTIIEHFKDAPTRSTSKDREKTQFLESLLAQFDRVCLILDAVDTLEVVDQRTTLELLSKLLSLKTIVKCLITCRPEEVAVRDWIEIESHAYVEISPSMISGDIASSVEAVIDARLAEDKGLEFIDMNLRQEIIDTICTDAKEMFLWANLLLNEVLECSSPHHLRETLRQLPRDIDATYDRILGRLHNSKGGDHKLLLFQTSFRWVTAARRPLKMEELQHAIAISVTDTSMNWDRIPSQRKLIESWANLLILNRETSTVRLAHQTVQQYLDVSYNPAPEEPPGPRHRWELQSQCEFGSSCSISCDLGWLCRTFLSFSDFETQLTRTEPKSEVAIVTSHLIPSITTIPFGASLLRLFHFLFPQSKEARSRPVRLQLPSPAPRTPVVAIHERYKLIDYAISHWPWHVKHVRLLNHPEFNLDRTLPFEYRPWKTTQHAKFDTPDFPRISVLLFAVQNDLPIFLEQLGWRVVRTHLVRCRHLHIDIPGLISSCGSAKTLLHMKHNGHLGYLTEDPDLRKCIADLLLRTASTDYGLFLKVQASFTDEGLNLIWVWWYAVQQRDYAAYEAMAEANPHSDHRLEPGAPRPSFLGPQLFGWRSRYTCQEDPEFERRVFKHRASYRMLYRTLKHQNRAELERLYGLSPTHVGILAATAFADFEPDMSSDFIRRVMECLLKTPDWTKATIQWGPFHYNTAFSLFLFADRAFETLAVSMNNNLLSDRDVNGFAPFDLAIILGSSFRALLLHPKYLGKLSRGAVGFFFHAIHHGLYRVSSIVSQASDLLSGRSKFQYWRGRFLEHMRTVAAEVIPYVQVDDEETASLIEQLTPKSGLSGLFTPNFDHTEYRDAMEELCPICRDLPIKGKDIDTKVDQAHYSALVKRLAIVYLANPWDRGTWQL